MDKETLALFDIELFKFEWTDLFDDGVQYTDVEFLLDSLAQYNGRAVFVKFDYSFIIYNEEGIEEEVKFSLIENDEFRKKLYEKYPASI